MVDVGYDDDKNMVGIILRTMKPKKVKLILLVLLILSGCSRMDKPESEFNSDLHQVLSEKVIGQNSL